MNLSTSHGTEPASAWVQRWSHLVRPEGAVLDVACGRGRHTLWFHKLGHPVVAVDRSAEALEDIRLAAPASAQPIERVLADLENAPWPLEGRLFDAIVVTHYLWRPLLPRLMASLAPCGVLIYETFTDGNETVGKPSRPDFLLRHGELLTACEGLRIVAYEDGFDERAPGEGSRFIQRIAAINEPAPDDTDLNAQQPPRYHLR